MFDFNLEFTELYYEFGKKIILGVKYYLNVINIFAVWNRIIFRL